MIVTFDTGILVRATAISDGPARRALDAVVDDPAHIVALSNYIFGEVGRVLSYPRMQSLFPLSGEQIHDYVNYLISISNLVEPLVGRPVVHSDPDDDIVVYTAVAAEADVLCTKDRHFYDSFVLKFCRQKQIAVMNDLELLQRLRT
jgi:putative PIN family toxin of toxin-antitoxin system